MYQFQCDYTGGCCPQILEKLVQTNPLELPGYCEDSLCAEAENLILKEAGLTKEEAGVFWAASGTMANLSVLTTVLSANEAVLASDTAHIHTAEAGAIEFSGHQILTVGSKGGKILPESIEEVCSNYEESDPVSRAHICRPRAVYISFPTELGTIYTLEELRTISGACKRHRLFLYIDGARLAYGLAASSDVGLKELAECSDAFYIGGTKCGALMGEGVVIKDADVRDRYLGVLRMCGGLIAKGRTLGCSFKAFFEDDLYLRLGKSANEKAAKIRSAFEEAGVQFYSNSPTNQLFPIVDENLFKRLSEKIKFKVIGRTQEGQRILRLCTSWSTPDEAVEALVNLIESEQNNECPGDRIFP